MTEQLKKRYTDAEILKGATHGVIEDPFCASSRSKLQQQLDKCQNQGTHDGSIDPYQWERCKAVLQSAKEFVSVSLKFMRYQ